VSKKWKFSRAFHDISLDRYYINSVSTLYCQRERERSIKWSFLSHIKIVKTGQFLYDNWWQFFVTNTNLEDIFGTIVCDILKHVVLLCDCKCKIRRHCVHCCVMCTIWTCLLVLIYCLCHNFTTEDLWHHNSHPTLTTYYFHEYFLQPNSSSPVSRHFFCTTRYEIKICFSLGCNLTVSLVYSSLQEYCFL
jgi:hypothetical protein